ncbi:hypothetical protein LTR70_004756 [Exophiala xenobiotica]|uniref:Uncharacterized protein n=1 Tax=Lithohypha guttulata TaxID=1690604 RepID=A0ABR0KCC6_9EURO|nr:hypothetical protein LTR24_004372 [Lithohypha guttulata]KAK5319970.1 hypothetical protein LTR70_004756 [Exophiala xenobiotica]
MPDEATADEAGVHTNRYHAYRTTDPYDSAHVETPLRPIEIFCTPDDVVENFKSMSMRWRTGWTSVVRSIAH